MAETDAAAGDNRDRHDPPGDFGENGNYDVVMRLPVQVRVVLGTVTMPVSAIANLGRGSILVLDRKVGEPVDVMINGRHVARGEVVVLEGDNSRFGISLTEIVGQSIESSRRR